jgi:hypothetical protein
VVDLLAWSHAQDGAPRLFGGNLHQGRDDLDLLAWLIGEPLRRQHGVLHRRRVAPYAAPTVLRVPYFAHLTPLSMSPLFEEIEEIIGLLLQRSKSIVQRTHNNFRGLSP